MEAGIAVIAILLFCTVLGGAQGGLRTIWSVGCIAVAILLSNFLNPVIAGGLTDQIHLNQYIEQHVSSYLEDQIQEINSNGSQMTAEIQSEVIDQLNLPSFWKDALSQNNTEADYEKYDTNGFIEYTARAIAAGSVRICAFVLTFLLSFILLQIVSITFKIVEHIPVLKQINRLVGVAAGFLKGLVIVWIIMIAIVFANNFGWGENLLQLILSDPIAAFCYKYNLLAAVFLSVF